MISIGRETKVARGNSSNIRNSFEPGTEYSAPFEQIAEPVLAGRFFQQNTGRTRRRLSELSRLAMALALITGFSASELAAVEDWSSDSSWLEGFVVFGSARFRPEFRANGDFNRKTDDTSEFASSKIQLGIAKDLTEDTKVVFRLQDSRVWGGSPTSDTGFAANPATSESFLTVREAYIKSDNLLGPLGIKMGRQILNYGSGRQLGRTDWNNVGRSFDAMEFHWQLGPWKSSLIGAVLAEEDAGAGLSPTLGRSNPSGINFNCDPTTRACTVSATTPRELDDAYMAAMYNEIKFHPQFQAEPYYIGIYKKWIPASTSPFPGLPIPPKARDRQRDNLHTIGLRFTNKTVNGKSASQYFDYSLEFAYQTGFNGQRVQAAWDILNQTAPNGDPIYTERQYYDAYVAYADIGIRPVEFLRIGLIADVASGDPNRNDAAVATYTQLYPTNHGPMGDMDIIGSRNMIARAIRLDFAMGKFGNFKIAYWHYKKHKAQDSFYANGGGVARDADGELLSTETESNARYGEVLDSSGKISENSVAQLSTQLFHEYNVTYAFKANGLSFAFGYGQAHALSSIRHRVDETYVRPDLREPAFPVYQQ